MLMPADIKSKRKHICTCRMSVNLSNEGNPFINVVIAGILNTGMKQEPWKFTKLNEEDNKDLFTTIMIQ